MRFLRIAFSLISFILLISTLMSCENLKSETTTSEKSNISLTVDNRDIILNIGDQQQINYQTNDPVGVLFESSDESIVSFSDGGLLTAVSFGSVTITVISDSDAAVQIQITVTVARPIPKYIAITGGIGITVDSTLSLGHIVTPDNSNQDVTWLSSNTSVATIDENGVITAISAGSTRITATSVEQPSAKGAITIYVKDKEPVIIKINSIVEPIIVGIDTTISTDITPLNQSDQQLIWQTDDSSVATITQDGVLTPLKAGSSHCNSKISW